jgi:murein DD-endopeptidase MepM/ murein hydrolase activator NlpD
MWCISVPTAARRWALDEGECFRADALFGWPVSLQSDTLSLAMKLKSQITLLAPFVFLCLLAGCSQGPFVDSETMDALADELRETNAFQYPLENYFPEIPVTLKHPPRGERYHAAEDCFAPAGTPVYAIGEGIVRFSGEARGYGGLIIIDHPELNVYSLYGHLSTQKWKIPPGEVKKGELIGYLGEAEEAYTMLPHLHFGVRTGQQADYPKWGNRRWMAGYTICRPDLVGWFCPSEIIGQTDAMREWHEQIEKHEDVVPRPTVSPEDFRITARAYGEKEDLYEAVQSEFGDAYRLADWLDIGQLSENRDDWADALGLEEGESNGLFVSNEGYRIWLGRQYFIARFDHSRPKSFLAHDDIDDDLVCLGSWQDFKRRLLAVRR